MTKKERLYKFRTELLDNLINILNTKDLSEKEIFLNEITYLRQILFESKELEKLIGETENE